MIDCYLGSATVGELSLQIIDPLTDEVIRNLDATSRDGLNASNPESSAKAGFFLRLSRPLPTEAEGFALSRRL